MVKIKLSKKIGKLENIDALEIGKVYIQDTEDNSFLTVVFGEGKNPKILDTDYFDIEGDHISFNPLTNIKFFIWEWRSPESTILDGYWYEFDSEGQNILRREIIKSAINNKIEVQL